MTLRSALAQEGQQAIAAHERRVLAYRRKRAEEVARATQRITAVARKWFDLPAPDSTTVINDEYRTGVLLDFQDVLIRAYLFSGILPVSTRVEFEVRVPDCARGHERWYPVRTARGLRIALADPGECRQCSFDD